MNIMFFLTHKSELVLLYDDMTVAQGMEIFCNTSYTAVPVLTREGRYLGTLTEGDFLHAIMKRGSFREIKDNSIAQIARHITNKPVRAEAQVWDLVETVLNQNFVPVIDDRDFFVGIVTRKKVLDYCLSHLEEFKHKK